ncbi:hypothetical protein Ddye_032054 [Dipteronia dyeriana]|uniref:Uncharacterized protein n=1 Tax=Dipteronia dyeriana TaxID=168575 RepID=A0AAD9WP12_9ROSI|nr:hypothetical protein Ddye_032054 [Dipteronia dyeriana]
MLKNVTLFDVSFNHLQGSLPYSIGSMKSLKQLNVAQQLHWCHTQPFVSSPTSKTSPTQATLPTISPESHQVVLLLLSEVRLLAMVPTTAFPARPINDLPKNVPLRLHVL